MADFRIAINLVANDAASATIRQMTAQVKALQSAMGRTGSAGGGLGGRKGKKQNPFGFPSAMEMHAAGAAVSNMGHQARAALTAPVMLAADFEAAINRVNALSGGKFAMTGELTQISAKARELGSATEFTATQSAEAFQLLTQAGFGYKDQMDAIEHVLNFATIGQVDMATSADLLTNTLGGFGLKANETERVANAMTRASLASQIELTHLGESFKYAAPQAAQLGFNVEQTATALAVLGKAGVRGSMGGTALRAFFNRLSTATGPLASKKQIAAMKMLGIDSATLKKHINSGDLASVPKYLAEAIGKKKMDKSTMVAALQGLFTERGGLGAAVLIRAVMGDTSALSEAEKQLMAGLDIDPKDIKTGEFATVWDDVETAMNDTGVTMAKTAGEIRTGTKHNLEVLKSSMEDLGITIGEKLMPQLQPLLTSLIEGTGHAAKWANENPQLVKTLAKAALGLAAFGLVFGPVITAVTTLRTLMKLGSALAGWQRAMGLMGSSATETAGKVSKLNMAHSVLGAFATGYTIGTLIDQYFGLSDAISGANQQLSIMQGLTVGFAKKQTPNTFLGNLTTEERAQMDAAVKRRDAAAAEREEMGFILSPMEALAAEAAEKKVMEAQQQINAIQAKGNTRGKGIGEMQKQLQQTAERAKALVEVRVKVDQENRFIGVEADEIDGNAGVFTEGM